MTERKFPDILAPYVPTPEDVVDRMLLLAEVTSSDFVYDLGCGDGRILISAARKYGARGYGCDVEPYWVAESQKNARDAGVEHQLTIELKDALQVDLSPATVITLYLVQWSIQRLKNLILRDARPGTRVVSLSFCMDDWEPAVDDRFVDAAADMRRLYLWKVPSIT